MPIPPISNKGYQHRQQRPSGSAHRTICQLLEKGTTELGSGPHSFMLLLMKIKIPIKKSLRNQASDLLPEAFALSHMRIQSLLQHFKTRNQYLKSVKLSRQAVDGHEISIILTAFVRREFALPHNGPFKNRWGE